MRRHKGLYKNTASWLLFLSFFVLSMISPALGWMGERKEDEKSGKEEKNQLKGDPSTFFMDIIYTQKKQFIFEIIPAKITEMEPGGILDFGFAGKFRRLCHDQ